MKIIPGIGSSEGEWTLLEFKEFLLSHSPQLSMHIHACKQFPPFHILNEELMSGGRDMGMSGGSFWKPYKITKEEYLELKENLLTDPALELEYDVDLEDKPNIKKWCDSVVTKHSPRNKNEE